MTSFEIKQFKKCLKVHSEYIKNMWFKSNKVLQDNKYQLGMKTLPISNNKRKILTAGNPLKITERVGKITNTYQDVSWLVSSTTSS